MCLHSVCLYVCGITAWHDLCQPNKLPSWGNKGSRYQIWNVLLNIFQSLKKYGFFIRSKAGLCVLKDNSVVSNEYMSHTKKFKSCPVEVWYVPPSKFPHTFIFFINVAIHRVQHDGSFACYAGLLRQIMPRLRPYKSPGQLPALL